MDRFWKKVDKAFGCWLWTGSVHKSGYGQFRYMGKTQPAHRVSYELFVGPIPEGLDVLHSCDERRCVNPAHLRPGTDLDNSRDKVERGRCAKTRRPSGPRRDNTSGVLGVGRHPAGTWRAQFKIPAGKKLQRYFRSFDEAVSQRRAWEAEHWAPPVCESSRAEGL